MALILEHTDSAYFPCFKTMVDLKHYLCCPKINKCCILFQFKNVVTALAESRDITLYLSPLMKHFLQFEETDFSESKPLLKPLLHVVCLVRDAVFYEICTEKKNHSL
jgi:dynein heavy chain, axonemal